MSQATLGEKSALVWREQERRRGKIFAFVAVTTAQRALASEYPFQIGVAILGEDGYGFPSVHMLESTYENASDHAEVLNTILGQAPETSIAIIADTMQRSTMKREEAEGLVTVKFTKEEARGMLDTMAGHVIAEHLEDDIISKLEGAME